MKLLKATHVVKSKVTKTLLHMGDSADCTRFAEYMNTHHQTDEYVVEEWVDTPEVLDTGS